MKIKSILIMMALACVFNAFSQQASIELSFSAVDNSQFVVLDSIFIKNLTQQGDTTIYYPESGFVIDVLGIDDLSVESKSLTLWQNYPNPIQQHTSFKLYLPEKDNVTIQIQNLLGQKLAFFESELSKGMHTFIFHPGHEDVYLLTAFASTGSRSMKMANNNKNGSNCRIVHSGFTNHEIAGKSQIAMSDFVFSFGDELMYIGYAKTVAQYAGSDIIEDAPLSDKTYQFEISEGIPCSEVPYFTHEGQQYSTVQIGSKCWMKENLNAGIKIDGQNEQSNNGLIEKYCYNDIDINCDQFGGLYQWDELMQYSNYVVEQGICPEGWLLPTNDDMLLLANHLGGLDIAGGKMKEAGTNNWLSPNVGASNASGFTGLPGGHRNASAGFWNMGQTGNFWTSTSNVDGAIRWYVDFNFEEAFALTYDKSYAYSVRCVKAYQWSCGDPIQGRRKYYNTVEIGNQCWMAENLAEHQYENLELVPNVTDNEEWSQLTTDAYAVYNNNNSWNDSYGYLYNWYAIDNPGGLCPEGWHVPGANEWAILIDFIGGSGEPHGNELKSCRQVDSPMGGACNTTQHPRWNTDADHYGTDDYGFEAVPGGFRFNYGNFAEVGNIGVWWSSSENALSDAFFYSLYHNAGEVGGNIPADKKSGYSVRCIKDQ